METDWEFEIGSDAPLIDAAWPGFVDLRAAPALAWGLPEAADMPALASALVALNSQRSPVWTSKCDLWAELKPADFDADELDAPPGYAVHASGCYIDILPQIIGGWAQPQEAETASKTFCAALRKLPLRCCRADLVVRRAILGEDMHGLGITGYITACGPNPTAAKAVLAQAIEAFAAALCAAQTLQ